MTNTPILETAGLKKYFNTQTSLKEKIFGNDQGSVQAVDDVNLTLEEGESIGIVGESGCGKSTLLRTLMGLYEPTGGEIRYKGKNQSGFDKDDWKEYRKNTQIIFQDPFGAINPKMTTTKYLEEPMKIHDIPNKEQRIRESLEQVELNPPERYLDKYPNELSGGELQRVCIARALIVDPDVILADEPLSMLDVSTQASILNLLARIREELDVSIIYISHDLSTVSYICESINVMYLGRIVEQAPTSDVLNDPKHPYSKALINAIPIPNPHRDRPRTDMEGSPREPIDLDKGCRFRDRCPERMDICEQKPEFVKYGNNEDRRVACHLHYDHEEGRGAERSEVVR